jgi:arylsulfatase A-like enzyme
MFLNEDVPEPPTLYDDYANRASTAKAAKMRVGVDMSTTDMKCEVPTELPENELRKWAYQRYIKDYLRVVASVDDNVGRVLDYLDQAGLAEDTLVVYTSDQGFFLGDHGWYDKRFMYEESLRMPFILRYPREVKPGSVNSDIVLNVDFAPLFLDLAGVPVPKEFQGTSFRPLLQGRTPPDWQQGMYYRYWMHKSEHNVYAHYGARTKQFKLIYYYSDALGQPGATDETCEPEWELFDLEQDPAEMHNVYADPKYAATVKELKAELHRLQAKVGDQRYAKDVD